MTTKIIEEFSYSFDRELFYLLLTALALFTIFIITSLRTPKSSKVGDAGLLGEVGTTLEALTPEGMIRIRGELWRARAQQGMIAVGMPVVVVEVEEGLILTVQATKV
jgi:membrane-bound serine protease (ClpP class)